MTWQTYFLGLIGAPASESNIRVCTLWAQSEGVLSDNNPYACSGHYPGATRCIAQCGSASEVMAYDTIEHGCEANARFLQGSYYLRVVAAFKNDEGEAALWSAINSSPWCSGCQDGKYPIDLWEYVHNTPPPEPTPTPTPLPKEIEMASSLSVGRNAGGTAIDVEYVDTNGHIIQATWDGTKWNLYDHTAGAVPAGAGWPAASTT